MTQYFFDVWVNDTLFPDTEGSDFSTLKEARHEALRTLGEIAKDKLRDGGERDFVISIREEVGPALVTASLSLRVDTHGQAADGESH